MYFSLLCYTNHSVNRRYYSHSGDGSSLCRLQLTAVDHLLEKVDH